MTIQCNNFYVLTGASSGGKSTTINALRARGHLCVDEVGRTIVKEQLSIGGDATPWQNPLKFCNLMLARAIHAFEQVTERNRPVFFDRGIIDGVAAAKYLDAPVPDDDRNPARIYRYACKVFVAPPWPEIFKTDRERRHSYEAALEDYRANVEAYREYGYELVELPKTSVSARVDFILNEIDSAPTGA